MCIERVCIEMCIGRVCIARVCMYRDAVPRDTNDSDVAPPCQSPAYCILIDHLRILHIIDDPLSATH